MKKQFDLEYYKAHPETKVVTRDGNPARIICANRKDSQFPVVALISRKDKEFPPYIFQENGHLLTNEESSDDLFMEIEGYDFKPFDKILVRNDERLPWYPAMFAYINDDDLCIDIAYNTWEYAIPYEGNEDKCGKVTKD